MLSTILSAKHTRAYILLRLKQTRNAQTKLFHISTNIMGKIKLGTGIESEDHYFVGLGSYYRTISMEEVVRKSLSEKVRVTVPTPPFFNRLK